MEADEQMLIGLNLSLSPSFVFECGAYVGSHNTLLLHIYFTNRVATMSMQYFQGQQ